MFVVLLTYKKPISEVDRYLAEHRAFLDECYRRDYFLVSGPQNPRIGGVIVAALSDRQQLEKILAKDPFCLHGIAEYEFIEFDPVKHHPTLQWAIK